MKHILLLCLVSVAATAAAPRIEFDRTVYDFGKTSLVNSVTGTFTFHNRGDEVLKVEQPKPSCGCTVAKINSDTLKPGEKAELVFQLAIGQHAQRLAKDIRVSSNDPKQPVAVLGIQVEVEQAFESIPGFLALGDVPLGMITNATVLVKRLDGQKLAITKVESSSNIVSAKPEPVDRTTANVHISLLADGQPGRVSEMVNLFTADAKGPALTIVVTARLLGDIELDPEALAWGMPDPEHWNVENPDFILERSVTITATRSDRPLEIRNVSCTLKELTVKLETVEQGKEYELTASLSKPLKQPIKGTINFETNLPSLPKVEIPVEVNVWRQ